MVKIFTKYILLVLCLSLVIFSQDFKARVSSDTTNYVVGDYINLKYTVTYENGIKYQIPSIKDSIPDLTYIKELPVKNYDKDSQLIEEHTFVFSKYDSAGVVVPSIRFDYTDKSGQTKSAYTNELALTVKTVEVNMNEEIQDVKSPIRIPLDWIFILLIVLVVLILLAAGYFTYRYYTKKKAEKLGIKPVIKVSPYQEALTSLRSLEEQKLWQQGKVKEYHTEITQIIRKYFEARFRFNALEMPSSDILKYLLNTKEGNRIYDEVNRFFSNADMVKFAKFQPMPSVNEEMMKQSYRIVEATKEQPVIEAGETVNVQ